MFVYICREFRYNSVFIFCRKMFSREIFLGLRGFKIESLSKLH